MPSCVFRKCKNYTATVTEKNNVSFHLLPREGLIREKWIEIIKIQRREDDWKPTAFSTICSQHFSANDLYVTKKNCRRLKKTAVPIIEQTETTKKTTNESSPTCLNQVNISDVDSVDTPREAYLKSKLAKVCQEKKIIQMRNNDLVRQNKRLREKCITLQTVLLKLKKKMSPDYL